MAAIAGVEKEPEVVIEGGGVVGGTIALVVVGNATEDQILFTSEFGGRGKLLGFEALDPLEEFAGVRFKLPALPGQLLLRLLQALCTCEFSGLCSSLNWPGNGHADNGEAGEPRLGRGIAKIMLLFHIGIDTITVIATFSFTGG